MQTNTGFGGRREGASYQTVPSPTMSLVLPVRTTRAQGITHIVLGVMMVGFQIAAIIVLDNQNHIEHNHSDSVLEVGSAIWCGLLVIGCGIIGCCAAAYKTNNTVIGFLIFNIFSLILSTTVLGMMGGDLSQRDVIYCDHRWINDKYEAYNCSPSYTPLIAMTSVLLFAALVVFSISIWSIVSSSIAIHKSNACCCRGRCCVKQEPPVYVYGPQHRTVSDVSRLETHENAMSTPSMGEVTERASLAQGYVAPPPYAPAMPLPKALGRERANPPYQQLY